MYINRALLLGLVLALVAFPFLVDWLTSDYTAWHRPYLVWAVVVFAAWLGQRSRNGDEL